jgi:hypothetical protein
MHQQQLSNIKTVQESLLTMCSQHTEGITKTNETAIQTQTGLETLPSRVKDLVMPEVSTMTSKSHAACSTILTEIRASSATADQNSEELKSAIRTLISASDTSRIAALLQPALEKVISDQIASSMEALNVHYGMNQPETSMPNTTAEQDNHVPLDKNIKSFVNEGGVRSLNQLSATKTCIRWAGASKVFNFWFGRLLLSTSVLNSWEGRGNEEPLQKAEFLEITLTLIPSRWLLRNGAILKITRLLSAIAAPAIQFSLVPVMVISEDHDIVLAMRYGDLERIQRLVHCGEVHPSSIFQDGSSLALRSLHELQIRIDSFGESQGKNEVLTQKTQRPYDVMSVIYWLIGQGIDVDGANTYGT